MIIKDIENERKNIDDDDNNTTSALKIFGKKMQNKWQVFKVRWKNNFRSSNQVVDFISKILIYFFATLVFLILLILVAFIVYKSIYFFRNYEMGFWGFLFGKIWNANNNQFGIWNIILSTFSVLLISLSLAIPLTIFSSLFICEYMSSNLKKRVVNIVQLLAGVPSVIFGLFSLSILGPLFMMFGAPSNSNLLVTSITLAFMGLPIMISLSINAIDSVPESYRLGLLALGSSKINITYRIVLKDASIKILAAIMLGVARIIGETTSVMMISGNVSCGLKFNNGFLNFIFSSISTLSSTIGLEMLENSNQLHESALYAIGLVLFILVFLINIFILWIQSFKKHRLKTHHKNLVLITKEYNSKTINRVFYARMKKTKNFKKILEVIGLFFLVFSTIIVISFTLLIIISILWKGLINLQFYDFISVSTYNDGAGILSTFLVTLLLGICSVIFAIPLSVIVAIYLNEYSRSTNFFTKMIRFIIDLLVSTPSIIYGSFGLAFFIGILKIPLSILSAGLTLTIVILPVMIRNIEDSLSNVSDSLRKSSLALGASKMATIVKIVIPNAMPGIITAIILAIGRIIGESAPVYLTSGTAVRLPDSGFLSLGASMTTEILLLTKEGATARSMQIMYELAFTIMILILFINKLAGVFSKRFTFGFVSVSFGKRLKNYVFFIKKIRFFKFCWNKISNNVRQFGYLLKIKLKDEKYSEFSEEGGILNNNGGSDDSVKKRKLTDFKKVIINKPNNKSNFSSYNSDSELIEIKNVSFYYKNDKQALFNISMKIKENAVTAFIGPSGCGKSTLLRILNRMNDMVPKTVLKGKILINGQDIYAPEMDIIKLRTDVGMVFQKPSPFPMSIYENVIYGPRSQGIKDKKLLNALAIDSLKKAALWDEVKDNLRDSALILSGGQQQRLCIARAIAMKPKILLMDEPTSALDPISTLKIEELIHELKKDFTIVLVTHQMQQAAHVADYTAFFLKGELIEYNKTKILFSRPKDRRTANYITGRFN